MLRLNQFLEPLMRRLDLYQPARERAALILWPQVVGPYVARNTAAVAIKRGVLMVRTSSSAWVTELSVGYRQQFITRLNERLGETIVTGIRFLPPPLPTVAPQTEAEPAALVAQPLSAEDEAAIEEVVALIEAPESRHRLRRLMRRDFALRRARMRAGWRPCPCCAVLTRDGAPCPPCVEAARLTRLVEVRRTLLRAPWSSPLDLKARIPAMTLQEYQLVKARLLGRLKTSLVTWSRGAPPEARLSGALLGQALRYCMLRFGKRPHELDQRDMRFALGRALFDRYPFGAGQA